MSTRAYISTRKGLFELDRGAAGWEIGASHFLGEPVSFTLADGRDGALYAALNLGHFGVKLHRKDAGSATWTEIAAPAYPRKPDDSADPVDWKNKLIWSMAAGGADQPGVLWAGTLPGGLFRSNDRGASWELVRALWDVPQRGEWFGGGYDVPGIHSICVDPRNSDHLLVGVSCGGVWQTRDGGASWEISATGMRADYMPPELDENEAVQDPHRIVRVDGSPDCCGASTTTASGARATAAAAGRKSRARYRVSALPSRPIRPTRIPPGSCRPRPTSAAFRSAPRWWSPAQRTAARASANCAPACRSGSATTWCIVTGWRWPATAAPC